MELVAEIFVIILVVLLVAILALVIVLVVYALVLTSKLRKIATTVERAKSEVAKAMVNKLKSAGPVLAASVFSHLKAMRLAKKEDVSNGAGQDESQEDNKQSK